jgi:hypothetical protein
VRVGVSVHKPVHHSTAVATVKSRCQSNSR